MTGKVWFITGATRGFGRIWTEAALKRGDKVAATGVERDGLAELKESYGDAVLPLYLDVTNPEQVREAVNEAHGHFGRLDVVLNNAGFSLVGTVEEVDEADVRRQFDVNFFGTLRVIQAALPLLRAQGSGHIIGVTSGLGLLAAPFLGMYCTSKWAGEALHETLAAEVKAFGIKVTMLEPGAYATTFSSPESMTIAAGVDAYAGLRKAVHERLSTQDRGDPDATVEALFKIVDADNPPLRFLLGSTVLPIVRAAYAERLAVWEEWEDVSNAAQGAPKKSVMADF